MEFGNVIINVNKFKLTFKFIAVYREFPNKRFYNKTIY